MDISPRERLAYGGAAIGLLAVPLMYFFPNLTIFIAIPMLVVGVALLLIAVFPMNISGWRVFIYGFIPLYKAAKKAYEENYDNLAAGFAEHEFANCEADPIGWFAHALIGSNVDETGVSIFGCKPQLDILTIIPRQEVYRHYLVVNENEASLQDRDTNRAKYDRLHIRKSDMKKRIKEISTWVK